MAGSTIRTTDDVALFVALGLLGELVSQGRAEPPPEQLVSQVRQRLAQCVEEDASGRQRLTISLPDGRSIDQLAQTMAALLLVGRTDPAS